MNIAVLIDAENVLPAHAEPIFQQAASMGDVVAREIFGAAQALTTWVEPVLKYAIHPNLTIRASKGKNSSDIALVIGAMDLISAGNINAAIIASSDSDFSALSVRLRNAGIEVIGMGTDKANALWRASCSSFVVLQLPGRQSSAQPQKAPKAQKTVQSAPQKATAQPKQKVAQPVQKAAVQPQQKDAGQAQPQPVPAKSDASSEPGGSHAERINIIRAFIAGQIEAAGGRMQISSLFSMLSNLPEYRFDQQRSRRRPLNYLMRQYSDAFAFEDDPDGNTWISPVKPADKAPETAAAEPVVPEPAEPVNAGAATDAPVEQSPESESRQADRVIESVNSVPAADADDTTAASNADDIDAPSGDVPDAYAMLLQAGLTDEVAQEIVVIFTECTSRRAAYNRLRATFGNANGRKYYHLVKKIDSEYTAQ